jgi:polar amino acid transport system substrate-binding protein
VAAYTQARSCRWKLAVPLRQFCCCALLCLAAASQAEDVIELYMPNAPPLTFASLKGGHGMVGDVTLAALARAGLLSELRYEPWARAQRKVANGRDQLIIPLSRTPEREPLYTWIAPIMPLERAFFSLDEPVQSFAEARQRYRRIGVGLGTAQVEILRSQGFSEQQIITHTLGENPAHLLERGRIDAWFTGVPEALYIWPQHSTRRLQMSPVLASTNLYLACSKECDAQLVQKLRAAVQSVHDEGISKRLIELYLPQPLDAAP